MVSRKELQTNYLLISADGQKELATVVRKYYVSYFSLLKDKQDFSDGTMTVSISTLPACSHQPMELQILQELMQMGYSLMH